MGKYSDEALRQMAIAVATRPNSDPLVFQLLMSLSIRTGYSPAECTRRICAMAAGDITAAA